MLADFNSAQPLPETRGLGSIAATLTRLIPASMMLLVQGGVRPKDATRLQSGIKGRAPSRDARLLKRVYLSVVLSWWRRRAPADFDAVLDHHGTYGGIWAGGAQHASGQLQGPCHVSNCQFRHPYSFACMVQ